MDKILQAIIDQARDADQKALEAFTRSKYSITDYWICIEFKFEQLANRISPGSCPHFPFRKFMNEKRREAIIKFKEARK